MQLLHVNGPAEFKLGCLVLLPIMSPSGDVKCISYPHYDMHVYRLDRLPLGPLGQQLLLQTFKSVSVIKALSLRSCRSSLVNFCLILGGIFVGNLAGILRDFFGPTKQSHFAAKGGTQKGIGHFFRFRSPFGNLFVTFLTFLVTFLPIPFCLPPFAAG